MSETNKWVFPYQKVKVPFKERRARVRWPGNNILAVRVYIAAEWWGRQNLPHDPTVVDIGGLSENEGYNFDVGIWRGLDLLDKHQIKATILINGAGAEFYPEVVRQAKQAGHEIAAHGYCMAQDAARMNAEQEKEDIRKTTAILESVSGERPRGWINPGAWCSERTFSLLVEQGYLWNGDLRDDDLPYGIKVGDKVLVELPHRIGTTSDFAFFPGKLKGVIVVRALRSSRGAVGFFQDTFDDYYDTANMEGPQMMDFGIHPFTSCWPDRIRALDKMIAHMKGYPGVWFATSCEVAEWWKKNYLR